MAQVVLFKFIAKITSPHQLFITPHSMSRRFNMIAPAACSSLVLLTSSLFVPVAHALVASPLGNLPRVTSSTAPPFMVMKDAPSDFTVINDASNSDSDSGNTPSPPVKRESMAPKKEKTTAIRKTDKTTDYSTSEKKPKRKKTPKNNPRRMDGTSWLEKNAAFNDEELDEEEEPRKNRSFREDFSGTRVFVKGIPPESSWQDLKDHFAVAGNVVFASVSVDAHTGQSKGVGLVQFETTDMALNAIKIMRDHPLDGSVLYVREDVQEQRSGGDRFQKPPAYGNNNNNWRDTPPSLWTCADDENSSILTSSEKEEVVEIIKARDAARRRKNYEASDDMRQELKSKYGVHVDDRLKSWWVSFDGSHVPQKIQAVKGDGRWGGQTQWRHIPTTPENDACVNPDLVNGLLVQRDIARREKDFKTADALLDEARNSPDGDLTLRIHDESRTWRIWTDAPPPRAVQHRGDKLDPADLCIALVREKAPHKEEEIKLLLEKFPGREWPIYKKLKKSLGVL